MSRRETLQEARVKRLLSTLHVAEPAMVVRFDAAKMTIDAQPLVMLDIGGTPAQVPQMPDVPVLTLAMGDSYLRPWYQPGDVGLLIYCDRDIDCALAGKVAAPSTARQHDLSDAVFVGGLCAVSGPSGLPDGALVLGSAGGYIALTQSGITIQGTLVINGVAFDTHTHTAPNGGGTTSGPS